jgi:3-hydroxyisobutyrate dehydrogenase
MARIGIAGLGRMGSAMAERLVEKGHALVVWNRSPGKVEPLVALGATAAESPAALAAQVDVVLTILSDAAAIETVYAGAEGVLAADLAGKTVLEMSTVRPEVQQALAGRVQARGGAHVECPVGGTTGPARQGRLLGVAGGAAEDVERVRPILDDLCRRVEHVGPTGAGASMKLAINLPLMVYYQALGEALTLVKHLGQDPAWLMDLLSDTSGAPAMLKTRAAPIAKALAGEEPKPVQVDLDLMRKDLSTMLAEARSRGAELPLVARALEVYDDAAAAGWGGRDATTVPSWWPSRAG